MNNEYLTPVNLRREIYDILNIHTDAEIINIYNHSKIYKIVSPSTDKIYIGSTTQTLAQRLGKHLGNYKDYTINNKGYMTSFEIIKLLDYSIVLLEECNFNNKQQLHEREAFYIKQNINICVNNNIPLRTQAEYRQDNKEFIAEIYKQYHINNKERITEYNKQYHINNKEHLIERAKQYRNDNKEPLQCECGLILKKINLNRHQQSQKHFTNINANINMIYLNELQYYK